MWSSTTRCTPGGGSYRRRTALRFQGRAASCTRPSLPLERLVVFRVVPDKDHHYHHRHPPPPHHHPPPHHPQQEQRCHHHHQQPVDGMCTHTHARALVEATALPHATRSSGGSSGKDSGSGSQHTGTHRITHTHRSALPIHRSSTASHTPLPPATCPEGSSGLKKEAAGIQNKTRHSVPPSDCIHMETARE